MRRLLLILATLLALTAPAAAAAPQELGRHDITNIIPGKKWELSIRTSNASGVPDFNWGKFYLATINYAPPQEGLFYARFYVNTGDATPGLLQLQLTPEQTTAIAGITGSWRLLYIPDIGSAQIVAFGTVTVRK